MSFKTRCFFTAALVVSLLIQMQIATIGYPARRTKIAFTCVRGGKSDICVMDGDGGNYVKLTDDLAFDTQPSWSPDGDRIAFNRGYAIHVMDADGRNLMKLTKGSENSEPSWSPDGTKVAFTRGLFKGKNVWVVDADGQNQIQLTQLGENLNPAWSPDGNRIAFVAFRRDAGFQIYVMDENGGNQERLTRGMELKYMPSWSPDGKNIVYEAKRQDGIFQIYVVKTDGSGHQKMLTRDLPHKLSPAWSPDGRTIAYVASKDLDPDKRDEIHLMTADGDYLKNLSKGRRSSDTDPDWFDPVGWSVSPAVNVVTTWGKIKKPTSALR